jgi:hypothetical protein
MTETRDLLARIGFVSPPATKKNSHTAKKRAGSEPGDEEPADSQTRESAMRLLRVQGAVVNCRKSAQEVLGVAEAFEDIRKQLINNRIDTEELKARLQSGIAEPLRAMVVEMFPELDRRLEKLQSALDDAQAGPALRDQAQQQADNILLAMRKVLDRMIALEDFNEVVETLRGIIKAEEQLQKEVQQRHKQKIRELLKE